MKSVVWSLILAALPLSAHAVSLDMTSLRNCKVNAVGQAPNPYRLSVGDFAIKHVSDKVQGDFKLSSFLRVGEDGKPSEVNFGVYFLNPPSGNTKLLTPYSVLRLSSADEASGTWVFATPPELAFQGDTSSMTLTAVNGSDQVVRFHLQEIVHGSNFPSLEFECTKK